LAFGKSKEIDSVNGQIEKYRTEIEAHYKTLVNDSGYVTAKSLKNALRGIGLNQNTVMPEYVSLVKEKRKSIGIQIEASTHPVYPTVLGHFKDFLREKYGDSVREGGCRHDRSLSLLPENRFADDTPHG
jgi:hypothetical protein